MKRKYITINVQSNVGFIELNKEQYEAVKKFKKSKNSFSIVNKKNTFKISKDSFSGNYGLNLVKIDECFNLKPSSGNVEFLNKILNKIIDTQNIDTVEKTVSFN